MKLDEREAEAILHDLLARMPGYVPGWQPAGPGEAINQAFARYLRALHERLNEAPDKNKLAFLDLLGISLLPAQAARAPVVFEMQPDSGNSRAPASTRLGADVAGRDEPLIFETEKTVGLAAARLAEVVALHPAKDAYADYSQQAIGAQPFTVFETLLPVPHEFYLAHDVHFALSGQATVELQFELSPPGSTPLDIAWEYFDGEAWRGFKPFMSPDEAYLSDSLDGTDGLTRSGIMRLVADCGASEQSTIGGMTMHWMRGRLNKPLVPDETTTLPGVDLVNVRTVISNFAGGQVTRSSFGGMLPPAGTLLLNIQYDGDGIASLEGPDDFYSEQETDSDQVAWFGLASGSYTVRVMEPGFPPLTFSLFMGSSNGARFEIDKDFEGIAPDAALANGIELDLSKTYFPFGQQAQTGGVFYFRSDEVFSKPGAEVTVLVDKATTPQEEGDSMAAVYQAQINEAENILEQLKVDAAAIEADLNTAEGGLDTSDLPVRLFQGDALDEYESAIVDPVRAARDLAAAGIPGALFAISSLSLFLTPATFAVPIGPVSTIVMAGVATSLVSLSEVLRTLSDVPGEPIAAQIDVLINAINAFNEGAADALGLPSIDDGLEIPDNVGDIPDIPTLGDLGNVIALGSNVFTQATALGNLIASSTNPFDWDLMVPEDSATQVDNLFPTARNRYTSARSIITTANNRIDAAITQVAELREMLDSITAAELATLATVEAGAELASPRLIYEYWNGSRWATMLAVSDSNDAQNFIASGSFGFTVPTDIEPVMVNDEEALWVRARIASGSFTRIRMVTWRDETDSIRVLPIIESRPPSLDTFNMGYVYRSPQDQPQASMTYNDFQWIDRGEDVRWRGASFQPFEPVADPTPALYFGFDAPLPRDMVSLYLDIAEVAGESEGPTLKWEYHDGETWRPLSVQDETNNLALSGMVEVLWPGVPSGPSALVVQAESDRVRLLDRRQAARFRVGDLLFIREKEDGELVTVAGIDREFILLKTPLSTDYSQATIGVAALPRFGTPRTWVRTRLQYDGDPRQTAFNSVYLNAAWASQTQTITGEILGSATGQVNPVFFFRQSPVLDDHVIEVRELEGARAAVELPILEQELLAQGFSRDDIRTAADPVTGEINAVWVRWQSRPNLLFSSPDDRHYVVERSRGRVLFGDGVNGRLLPAAANNIRAAVYRTGGGLIGNVSAEAISQLLGAVPSVQGVMNPIPAAGGADGEKVDEVRTRGPRTVRHHKQAVTISDYEALAREASPEVAMARALPNTHPSGYPAAGWVRVIIMPESQPQPSLELRRRVQDYLTARVPASIADRISVAGPEYLPVGVEARIAPLDFSLGGQVIEDATAVLTDFFDAVSGGPDGTGWPFGRAVYLSDVAAILEAVAGVDYAETINLLLDNTPQGERVDVPPDRIVTAGTIRISLVASERSR